LFRGGGYGASRETRFAWPRRISSPPRKPAPPGLRSVYGGFRGCCACRVRVSRWSAELLGAGLAPVLSAPNGGRELGAAGLVVCGRAASASPGAVPLRRGQHPGAGAGAELGAPLRDRSVRT